LGKASRKTGDAGDDIDAGAAELDLGNDLEAAHHSVGFPPGSYSKKVEDFGNVISLGPHGRAPHRMIPTLSG